MSKNHNVAIPVIRRLPRYYRFISSLIADGTERISSKELSRRMGLTASQIRQDLNCFGGFGQQGYGYNLAVLKEEIGKILGIDEKIKAVLIGAGNIGKAIGSRMDFAAEGFELAAIFDSSSEKIGMKINELSILDAELLSDFCINNSVKAAILCVSDEGAESVAETLVSSGVSIFWNFTHFDISLHYPEYNLAVENVHLNDSLMTLRYLAKDIK